MSLYYSNKMIFEELQDENKYMYFENISFIFVKINSRSDILGSL